MTYQIFKLDNITQVPPFNTTNYNRLDLPLQVVVLIKRLVDTIQNVLVHLMTT